MTEEAVAANKPSEHELVFRAGTREIRTEQKIGTAVVIIDQDEGKQLLADHIRRRYQLGLDMEIKVEILNTDRTDDLCEVTIIHVVK